MSPTTSAHEPTSPPQPAAIAVWLLVAAVVVLFAAFSSTYVARRSEPDWRRGPRPPVLVLTTLALLLSSALLEWGRRRGRGGDLGALRAGLAATTGLGVAFLAGQALAWRQMVGAGVGLTAGPHSAFFYLLSGAHGLHVAGGVVALALALRRAARGASPAASEAAVGPAAIYWHAVDGLWLYLYAMLFWL